MTMTDDERKQIASDYLKAFDLGGVTPQGTPLIELFAPDAEVYFPKWGVARGVEQIGRMLADIGAPIRSITHHHDQINWILTGGDVLVAEGTSDGEHEAGPWRAGDPEWGAGRWCDVFEIRDFRIHRVYIYLDPDYAGADIARYPWIAREDGGGPRAATRA